MVFRRVSGAALSSRRRRQARSDSLSVAVASVAVAGIGVAGTVVMALLAAETLRDADRPPR